MIKGTNTLGTLVSNLALITFQHYKSLTENDFELAKKWKEEFNFTFKAINRVKELIRKEEAELKKVEESKS